VTKPDGVPVDEVTAAVKALNKNVATLRGLAQQVNDIADGIHTTWQGLEPGAESAHTREATPAATVTTASVAVDGIVGGPGARQT
jgi:hypothetical protein